MLSPPTGDKPARPGTPLNSIVRQALSRATGTTRGSAQPRRTSRAMFAGAADGAVRPARADGF
ncbi:hypothetical protein I549_3798 [Mycobacterium avium subsp. avium 2285 (R)]|nr:hypothetical protein I549_3798 [Mycobacterium avium subsp. avium 2285 (R)]